jgi:hypothetical protein
VSAHVILTAKMAFSVVELVVREYVASVAGVSRDSGSAVEAHSQPHIADFERAGSSPHTGKVLVTVYVVIGLAKRGDGQDCSCMR